LRPELLKGHLDGLVLAVLADESAHGYAIMERLHERSGGELVIEGGTLYPVLHRLEHERLISGRWSVESGRRRRTYALTSKGRTALRRERTAWQEFVTALDSFMAQPSGGVTA
jgi:DNA-binding PadR family transcriptional regulator